ncbi:hypothetical protein GCM10028801_30630 [Nocardioides maradonensis]
MTAATGTGALTLTGSGGAASSAPSASGSLSLAASGTALRRVAMQGTAQVCRFDDGHGGIIGPSTVSLAILDDTLDSAPGPLSVNVSGANAGATLTFTVGVDTVWTDVADAYGNLQAATIELPLDLTAGTYSLVVTTVDNGTDSASFALSNDSEPLPGTLPGDTTPVPTSSAGQWVFQDLMPSGLGTWTLPVNPSSMTNPHFERNVTTRHATSPSQGQFAVAEAAFVTRPWRITGYYPDQDFYNKLLGFCGIRRRFYVQDHRERIWLVGVQSFTTTPRKRQSDAVSVDNDWAGSYDLTFTLYSQMPVTP